MDSKALKHSSAIQISLSIQIKNLKLETLHLNGHTGIVTEVEKGGKIKLTHARGVGKDSKENPYAILPPIRRFEFYGYYRPKEETPDGKLDKSKIIKSVQRWREETISTKREKGKN